MARQHRTYYWLAPLVLVVGGALFWAMLWCMTHMRPDDQHSLAQLPSDSDLDIVLFGSSDAPNTIYMYANYQCRYCQQFFEEVLPDLGPLLDSIRTRLVLKLVGKSTHPAVQRAQRMAVCVHRYGNYTALHNLLTFNYLSIYTDDFQSMVDDFIDRDHLVAQCMLDGEAADYLEANNQEFDGMGFAGTPVFVVNNHAYVGFRKLRDFAQIVDFEIKRKNKLN
ncbi:MAG: thioredoxin domain-containing protein [Bacteroidales bacterium]|nr:thioredoxin domain-containing protein [Bacteroidales bacterium]